MPFANAAKAYPLSATAVAGQTNGKSEDARIIHLLNRITFGPTAEDIALVKRIGINAYIEAQLNPASVPEDPALTKFVAERPALANPPLDLMREYGRNLLVQKAKQSGLTDKTELQKTVNKTYKDLNDQILSARIAQDVLSSRQLEELMTEFWYNHFNISINKGPFDRFLVGSFEQEAIRPYALGKFRDLLGATAHHPAMLYYLDNWENTDPTSPGARGRFKGINENYARELMELHTLGVDGGYSQQDVVALAHILTGLTFPAGPQLLRGGLTTGQFGSAFIANRHDFSTKQLLGHTISGQGQIEIEQALDILAAHPSTAHHISYQLAQFFVSDTPPAALVDHLSTTYMRTGGDIKAMMNTLLHSQEFWSEQAIGAKYKSPYRYAISVLRTSGTVLDNFKKIDQFLKQMGEPLYGCLTPDGYKNTKEAWLNSDGLLKRIAFAGGVANGAVGTVPDDETQRVMQAVGPILSEKTIAATGEAEERQKAGLLMGSPEFMTY
jgi:uncharacterized protein (DUF1800 family)